MIGHHEDVFWHLNLLCDNIHFQNVVEAVMQKDMLVNFR